MRLVKRSAATIAAIGLLCFLPFCCSAATTNVLVGPAGARVFSPATVTINVGDSVIWTWQSTPHSTTSGTNGVPADDNGAPSGLWDSTLITSTPHTFTNTFTTSGNFSYYCSKHYSFGMTGMVFVTSSALPPTVSITSPASNTVFAAPASVTIQADASGNGSAITNVQFLAGSTVLANATSPPFSATANISSAGNYTLSAIASDNDGITATNSVPISVVTPAPVSLASPAVVSSTNFQFSYLANTGLTYVIQRSLNLSSTNWVSLITNVASSNPAVFLDAHATSSPAFYRVGRMPNP
jgi:plastocyanin